MLHRGLAARGGAGDGPRPAGPTRSGRRAADV